MSILFRTFAVEIRKIDNHQNRGRGTPNTTTMAIINDYVKYLEQNRGYSQQTCKEYRKDLEKFVRWLRSSTDVERWGMVTKSTIDRWVSDMSAAHLTASTIKRRVSALRGLYTYAWLQGWCQENPAKYVSTPKKGHTLPKTADGRMIWASIHDTGTMEETRMAVAIMAETGCRLGELLNMKVSDIDQEERTITVRGKGNKERKVYYGDETASALRCCGKIGHGYLITKSERETRYNVHAATGASPHNIRHTWATQMLNNGCPLESISKMMGHASVKTTEIYAEVATATLAADYNKYKPNYGKAKERTTA